MKEKYSLNIIEWLRANKNNYENRQEITNAINKELGLKLPVSKINYLNNHYKLNLNRMPEKHPKLMEGLKIGWKISRGCRLDNVQIGEEINLLDRGGIYVKVKNDGCFRQKYIDKKRLLYQQYHNIVLDKDDIIVHLNGNKRDYSIENLFKIKRSVSINMSRNGYYDYKNSAEMVRSIIKFCEWKLKLNSLEGK